MPTAYTVRLVGVPELPCPQRIAAEVQFAQALEARCGGAEVVRHMHLAAKAVRGEGIEAGARFAASAPETAWDVAVRVAEAAAWPAGMPPGATFEVSVQGIGTEERAAAAANARVTYHRPHAEHVRPLATA